MNGYKGKIVFRKYTEKFMEGCIHVGIVSEYQLENDRYKKPDKDSVYIGECEVDVEFIDSRLDEIEAIERQIENERAEHQMRLNTLLGRKQELLALEG